MFVKDPITGLDHQETAFCHKYLEGLGGNSQAPGYITNIYIDVYHPALPPKGTRKYATRRQTLKKMAQKILDKDAVKSYINKHVHTYMGSTGVNSTRVYGASANLAFDNVMKEFFNEDNTPKNIHEIPHDIMAHAAEIQTSNEKCYKRTIKSDGTEVEEVLYVKSWLHKVKLYDRQKSIDAIATYIGMKTKPSGETEIEMEARLRAEIQKDNERQADEAIRRIDLLLGRARGND